MRQSVLNRNPEAASPIDKVVRAFGSQEAAALAMGLTVHAIDRMRRPRARNGGGGLIASQHHAGLLKLAREQNLPLTAEDLIGEAY